MFQFSWALPSTTKPNGVDIEMGDTTHTHSQQVGEHLLERTSPSTSMLQTKDTSIQQADDHTISPSAPAVLPVHMSLISNRPSQQVVGQPPQQLIRIAPRNPLPVATRDAQPPGSPSKHRRSRSPQPPHKQRRSKSPSSRAVVAQKVRLVTHEDPQQVQEFALMKQNVRLFISNFQDS